jgi:hypothetical protein
MDREEYMGRNEWLVQFLFLLMLLLAVGIALDFGIQMVFAGASIPDVLKAAMLFIPGPLDKEGTLNTLGMLMGFIETVVIFFLMGVLKPKKTRRPIRV